MALSDQAEVLRRTPQLDGRFTVVKLLGRGTAGSVYLVNDAERKNELVALKLLSDEFAFDEHTITRFREEWEVCKKISHPYLVHAYDLFEYDKCLGFTMEYVEGCDLSRLLEQNRFSYPEIDRILFQMLDALSALHAANIMHRDIKLENVILKRDGNIKLSDLGLLKRAGVKSMTRPGILLGTPQYMPPEYIRHAHFDFRSDIYACGVVLYELLSGKRRMDEKRGAAAITHLIETNFQFPRIEFAAGGRKYPDILKRSLAVSASERFQSVKEMQKAFNAKEHDNSELYSPGPQVSFYFGGEVARRAKNARPYLLAAAVLMAFVLGVVIAWYLLK